MEKTEFDRKAWNKQQTELRKMLSSSEQHAEAIQLFLRHHAMLHSARVCQAAVCSYEDQILDDMSEEQVRRIPRNCEHSVAWLIWHLARIEDVAMNILVAGSPQILYRDGWFVRLGVTARDTGNEMDAQGVVDLSAAIDIEALRAYRVAAGHRTREIVAQLAPEELKHKVEPARLQQVLEKGAVVEAAGGLIAYWSKRNIAGLLLMPPTRHCFVHLNEAARVKKRRA